MKNLMKIFVICLMLTGMQSLYAQADQIIYSHSFHAFEVGAECADCHLGAAESELATDNLLPAMETCYNCHNEDDTDCSVCHTNPDEAGEYYRIIDYIGKFPHSLHVNAGADCQSCHTGIFENEDQMHLPAKETCNNCHEAPDLSFEKGGCELCHSSDFNLLPSSHTVVWNKNHGMENQFDNNSCAHCHQTSYCQNCHQGDNLDREVHPLNFVNSHGILAKGNKENCTTCHQEQSFCMDCHSIRMVMPKNHSMANWSNTKAGDGGRHGKAALYDFEYCLSCHNDVNSDIICANCHN